MNYDCLVEFLGVMVEYYTPCVAWRAFTDDRPFISPLIFNWTCTEMFESHVRRILWSRIILQYS
jgi:hypothetical protein